MNGPWFVYITRGIAAWVEGPFETQEQAQDHQTRVLIVPEADCRVVHLYDPMPKSREELLEKLYEAARVYMGRNRNTGAFNAAAFKAFQDALNAVEDAA